MVTNFPALYQDVHAPCHLDHLAVLIKEHKARQSGKGYSLVPPGPPWAARSHAVSRQSVVLLCPNNLWQKQKQTGASRQRCYKRENLPFNYFLLSISTTAGSHLEVSLSIKSTPGFTTILDQITCRFRVASCFCFFFLMLFSLFHRVLRVGVVF